jgi:hypothetical protein
MFSTVATRLSSFRPFSLLTFALLLCAACGAPQAPAGSISPPAADPEAEPAQATPEPSSGVLPSDNTPPPAEASSAPEAAATTPSADLSATELCQKMCDRVRERCTKETAEACRGNCREWHSPPPGCEAEVKQALQCARDAEDLQCVNIVPSSCTRKFKRIEACASGKKLDTQEMSLDMPQGWQRFEAKDAGFAIPMPPGVEAKETGSEKSYSANVGGVVYSVRVLPAPDPKTKDLQVAQNVLGDCMKKLQLKGLIERPERRSLEFKAGCSGGRQASGLLVTTGKKLYVVSVTGLGPPSSERDVFVYGFKAPL